jgi:hypothetical protein
MVLELDGAPDGALLARLEACHPGLERLLVLPGPEGEV